MHDHATNEIERTATLALPPEALARVHEALRANSSLISVAQTLKNKDAALEQSLNRDRDEVERLKPAIETGSADELLEDLVGPTDKAKLAKMVARCKKLEETIPSTMAARRRLGPLISKADADAKAAAYETGHVFARLVAEVQADPAARVRAALATLIESFRPLVAIEAVRRQVVPAEFEVPEDADMPFSFDYPALLRRILAAVPHRFTEGSPDVEAIVRAGYADADPLIVQIINGASA